MNKILAVLAALMIAAAAGCDSGGPSGDQKEKAFTEKQQEIYNIGQPPDMFDASQARENLRAAHRAMAYGANSWTIQYVEGVGVTFQCPSIGYPIPYGAQLTNPEKVSRFGGGDYAYLSLPQMEPYGLYVPPDVAATYGNCVLPSGQIGVFYSEPPLTTFGFEVKCDKAGKECVIPRGSKSTVKVTKVDPKKVNARPAKSTNTREPENK